MKKGLLLLSLLITLASCGKQQGPIEGGYTVPSTQNVEEIKADDDKISPIQEELLNQYYSILWPDFKRLYYLDEENFNALVFRSRNNLIDEENIEHSSETSFSLVFNNDTKKVYLFLLNKEFQGAKDSFGRGYFSRYYQFSWKYTKDNTILINNFGTIEIKKNTPNYSKFMVYFYPSENSLVKKYTPSSILRTNDMTNLKADNVKEYMPEFDVQAVYRRYILIN